MPSTFSIDASVLAAADDLSLVARGIVEGFFDGLHRSPFLGYSTEFSAYRPYTKGDNLRHIDWKVWGRSDELYVKQFEDDTNLRCHIFLDTSASMDFGANAGNKFDYGRVLAAVLSFLMTRQHDAPGLILFGAAARQAAPALATRHHANEILHVLSQAQAGGKTFVDQTLLHLAETITRRGLAVIISDFFSTEASLPDLLRQLQAQGQEVLVFQTLAAEELDLPYEGDLVMEDAETGEEIPVHAEDYRKEYLRRLDEFRDRIKDECTRHECDYHLLRTDAPLDFALLSYLEKRSSF